MTDDKNAGSDWLSRHFRGSDTGQQEATPPAAGSTFSWSLRAPAAPGDEVPVDEGTPADPPSGPVTQPMSLEEVKELRDAPAEFAPVPMPMPVPVPVTPGGTVTSAQKVLLWVVGVVLALLALVALFLMGMRISADGSVRVAQPAPAHPHPHPSSGAATPVPTPSPGLGPLHPGTYAWTELRGGECVEPFASAWENEYTVVACSALHSAQLLFTGALPDAADSAYPSSEELQNEVTVLCSSPKILDYDVAEKVSDFRITASFPPSEEAWNKGERSFACFGSRSSGQPLPGSVATTRG